MIHHENMLLLFEPAKQPPNGVLDALGSYDLQPHIVYGVSSLKTGTLPTSSPSLILLCIHDPDALQRAVSSMDAIPQLIGPDRWLLTTNPDPSFRALAFQLGLHDVLPYPLCLPEFQSKLRRCSPCCTPKPPDANACPNQALLREALKLGKMGYWTLDMSSLQLHLSQSWFDLAGIDPSSVGGHSMDLFAFTQKFHAEHERKLIEKHYHLLMGMESSTYHNEFFVSYDRKHATPGRMRVRYHAYKDPGGKITVLGISRDESTEASIDAMRKEYEFQLAFHRAGFEAANVAAYQIGEDGIICYVNDCALRMTGYSREEMLRMHIADLDPSFNRSNWTKHRKRISNQGVRVFETNHRCKDGHIIDVEVTVELCTIQGQEFSLSFVRDLSERNAQRRHLEASRRSFRDVLSKVHSLSVVGINRNFTITFWNQASQSIYGYSNSDIIGRDFVETLITGPKRESVSNQLKRAFDSGVIPAAGESVRRRIDGREVTVFSSAAIVCLNDQAEIYFFDLDLSASKAIEAERERTFKQLREAKEQAERANRSKDEFLAVMSHEMRTPLNPILGFSNILRHECKPEQNEYLQIIYESAERLRRLINDVLDYTRLGRGDVQPKSASFDLLELCQTSFLHARQIGQHLKLVFTNGFDTFKSIPGPLDVSSDSHMILRILDNLLTNACKYTQVGTVEFKVGYAPCSTQADMLEFHAIVEDSGIGIDPDHIETLFEPFTQVDRSYTRHTDGVGLGLAICKNLVNLLGGTISATSQPDIGSSFRVTIPVQHSLPSAKSSEPAQKWPVWQSKPHILVVDDSSNNAKIATVLLSRSGAQCAHAADGAEAVSLCSGTHFDLILMDLSMPVMDGLEATRVLRQTHGPNQHTPIVGLSAHVSEAVQQSCRDSGMDAYLEKPIQAQQLLDVLHRFIR
jgi:PAS domain S-box-containing protein